MSTKAHGPYLPTWQHPSPSKSRTSGSRWESPSHLAQQPPKTKTRLSF
jgi:hypothetical protein